MSVFKNVLVWTGVALGAYHREMFKRVCEFEVVTVGIAVSAKWKKEERLKGSNTDSEENWGIAT